ncbi:Receptor-type tyrosine-protein like [Melia azedarach]|uniref:Receptor-type tyrosine-protein like n=1 Tax=Melia azedarach TaxID=155640 RepID=A0ACC1Y222_MELAZ|nr:Receptor-type tyrosine-protein like [Melia azedarach]
MLTTMEQESQTPKQTLSATVIRRPIHRRLHLRRRKLPVVRLGSKKPRRRLFLFRILRRFRLRWLKLHYACMLQKLKKYYSEVIKDIRDASATLESFQQRIFMESTFAVPVMGVSLSTFPSVPGSDRPRSHLFM